MDTIIFDIDGTLTDTEYASTETLHRVLLEETGRDYNREELRAYFGIPAVETIERIGVPDVARVVKRWSDAFCELCEQEVRLFEGIAPLLEELRRREVKLGLVSSKTREQYARTFQRLGFDDAFVQIICADLTEKHKPYPEPIEKFFELTGLPKQGAVYIGDTVHDCACAHGAGIAFGLAGWGCLHPEGIDAEYKFEHPHEVLSLLSHEPVKPAV